MFVKKMQPLPRLRVQHDHWVAFAVIALAVDSGFKIQKSVFCDRVTHLRKGRYGHCR